MRTELQNKIDSAIKIIRWAQQNANDNFDGVVEICYSGGKDSDVILQLAKEAGINYRAIYKNTTIDPPGTIKHAKEMGAEILQPKESFLKLIVRKGMPTRRARFCCEVLKEYKVLDVAVQGIRRCESTARAERYKEPQICRVYNAKSKVKVYLPILDWTDQDVEEFIKDRGIKCAPVYYDEQGNFHVERRLGCLGCPMQSDNGLADFKKYPKLAAAAAAAAEHYMIMNPQSSCRRKFRNGYELFVHNIFFDTYQSFKEAVDGMFGTVDCKKFLENYFNIKLK